MQTALEEVEDEESDETLQPKQRTMRGVAPAKSLKKTTADASNEPTAGPSQPKGRKLMLFESPIDSEELEKEVFPADKGRKKKIK